MGSEYTLEGVDGFSARLPVLSDVEIQTIPENKIPIQDRISMNAVISSIFSYNQCA